MFRPTLARLLVVAATAATLLVAGGASAEAATPTRTFSCTGQLDFRTQYTVAGSVIDKGQPYAVTVTNAALGGVVNSLRGKAASAGASAIHPGYRAWNITGANAGTDVYLLHAPGVLAGPGGFFDADLEVQFAGGANGGIQVPMLMCTLGGTAKVEVAKTRTFSCTGTPAEAATKTDVTGVLNRVNQPSAATVTGVNGILSTLKQPAPSAGASWFQTGFTSWDITGPDAIANTGDQFILHVAPVLPGRGGYFHALLEINFAVGGSWQIDMPDCTVK